jgi:hypothetical protein
LFFGFWGRGVDRKLPAGSAHLRRLDSGEWGSLYARSLEFPDFSARYGAPGSIAGHRRGVRVRAVLRVLATRCAVLESKADMQECGQASPDGGDALALKFAQAVEPAEVEEEDEEEEFGRIGRYGSGNSGWMR